MLLECSSENVTAHKNKGFAILLTTSKEEPRGSFANVREIRGTNRKETRLNHKESRWMREREIEKRRGIKGDEGRVEKR